MSILTKIFNKIFPSAHANEKSEAPASTAPTAAPATTTLTPSAPISEVDVEKVLNDLAAKTNQPLNWRTSIVDLLKLLELDSSLQARKELAQELHYTGDTNDSAAMNIWLHKQVMNKLAANGGKVPADLKD